VKRLAHIEAQLNDRSLHRHYDQQVDVAVRAGVSADL
jgi:hypothetical protein